MPRPPTKKQRVAASRSASADGSVRSGSALGTPPPANISSPETTKPKRVRAKRPAACRVVAKADPKPTFKAKAINKVLRSKVQQVLAFTTRIFPNALSALVRESDDRQHAIVAELVAIGALMRMRSDYQVSDPTRVPFDDLDEILLRRFTKRNGNNPSVQHVVLDLSQRSKLEKTIQSKIEGHGTAKINLLEVEPEMLARDLEIAIANDLFRHVQAVYEESDSSAGLRLEDEELITRDSGKRRALVDETKEFDKVGICPAPLMYF